MRQLFPLERPWAEGKGERNDHEREQKVCNWSVWLLKGAFNELNVIGNEVGGIGVFLIDITLPRMGNYRWNELKMLLHS